MKLGRAVQLASAAENQEKVEMLAKVVDVEDASTGRVRLKKPGAGRGRDDPRHPQHQDGPGPALKKASPAGRRRSTLSAVRPSCSDHSKWLGDEGAEVQVPARKERALLAFLALRAGSDVSGAGLIRALWGDEPPRSATKTLQTYVSALRRVLPAGTIETTRAGTGWRSLPTTSTSPLRAAAAVRGEALEAGDLRRAAEDTTAALALWRGSPCPTWPTTPSAWPRRPVGEMRRTAEERNFAARLALGEHAELVGDLEIAVAAEPLRERRWEQLMVALYRSGTPVGGPAGLPAAPDRAGRGAGAGTRRGGPGPGSGASSLTLRTSGWRPSQLSRWPRTRRT